MSIGVILVVALFLMKKDIFGFALAGPLVFFPWTIFLLCHWFRPGIKHWPIILWCKAVALDVLVITSLSWPLMFVFG